jgi:FKBP-type peptidyl-prolyl cis-trans isomerase FkpA
MRRAVVSFLFAVLAACGAKNGAPPAAAPPPPAAAVAALEITELQPGTGPQIAASQTAVVNYTGWLYEPQAADKKGKQFDSSLTTGAPFRFKLGAGEVIKGWDQGVLGMQPGGRRRLIIPADLAYGDRGAADVIPPGAALVFDVELLAIE